ncbi:CGP-CTERM sorting domain-containing protein [Thermococcus sp. AM4]|uniref:CGP-CTERM sorting domain-containing protein n=1 Tax=Thermococcus sp. (strain AM4) TaxID=246969 RepID=UPI000186F735|nr:CGP-CTERM sorting domain-containing protein [Thermococcus sp. AM4]EEB74739.1 hypothetical protein TAM4_684 [Thermococcus sp. AM4]
MKNVRIGLVVLLLLAVLVQTPMTAGEGFVDVNLKLSDFSSVEPITAVQDGSSIVIVGEGQRVDELKRYFLIKLDKDWNLEWVFSLHHEGADVVINDVAVVNGDIIVVGTFETGPSRDPTMFVARFSGDGRLKWAKLYGIYDGEKDMSVLSRGLAVDVQGNDILVGGTYGYPGIGDAYGWILHLDGSGNVLRSKTFRSMVYRIHPAFVRHLDDGRILVGGASRGGFLMVLDNDSVQWARLYGGVLSVNAGIKTESGFLVVFTAPGKNWQGNGEKKIVLAGLGSDGSVLWAKGYGVEVMVNRKSHLLPFSGEVLVQTPRWIAGVDETGNPLWFWKTYACAVLIQEDKIVSVNNPSRITLLDIVRNMTHFPEISEIEIPSEPLGLKEVVPNFTVKETGLELVDENIDVEKKGSIQKVVPKVLGREYKFTGKSASKFGGTDIEGIGRVDVGTEISAISIKLDDGWRDATLVNFSVKTGYTGRLKIDVVFYDASPDDLLVPDDAKVTSDGTFTHVELTRQGDSNFAVVYLKDTDPMEFGTEFEVRVEKLVESSESQIETYPSHTTENHTPDVESQDKGNDSQKSEGSGGICGPGMILFGSFVPVLLLSRRR